MGLKIFCFFILSIFACSKVNQWKQPTKVCFAIDIVDTILLDGCLKMEGGHVWVESFKFDGKRTEGADVYFTKSYQEPLNTPLKVEGVEDLKFDVPQGVYTSIDLEVFSRNEQGENIVIDGVFKNTVGKKYAVRVALDQAETFFISGEDIIGTDREVDLTQISKTKATIWLNPLQWFSSVEVEDLEHAEKIWIKGVPTIVIDKSTNLRLYNKVVLGLVQSKQKAIFIKQS